MNFLTWFVDSTNKNSNQFSFLLRKFGVIRTSNAALIHCAASTRFPTMVESVCQRKTRFFFVLLENFHFCEDWTSSLNSIVNGKTENHLDMLDNMVIERLLNDKWSAFGRVKFSFGFFHRHRKRKKTHLTFIFSWWKAYFVRQLILLCLHLFFLSVAIFLRDPKSSQPLAKRVICYIAEFCVLVGCLISIIVLFAKEVYLQGFNYYIQNLVKLSQRKSFRIVFFSLLVYHWRKPIRKNYCINVLAFLFSWQHRSVFSIG